MMNKWEVARYLIDAKKNIDSIMYINKNIYELNNIDVSLKIRDVMQSFYLNLSYVLDEKYNTKDIEIKDSLEIYVDDSKIILKKYEPTCVFCGESNDVITYNEKIICKNCLEKLKNM